MRRIFALVVVINGALLGGQGAVLAGETGGVLPGCQGSLAMDHWPMHYEKDFYDTNRGQAVVSSEKHSADKLV